jgi:thioesterase domain-containing protein
MGLAKQLEGYYNCYGLQDKGFDRDEPFENSMEEKSRRFATEIIEAHKGKEIVLCGFSIGGLVAFEIAKQLELKGYMTTLILLDSAIEIKSWLSQNSLFKSKRDALPGRNDS